MCTTSPVWSRYEQFDFAIYIEETSFGYEMFKKCLNKLRNC